MFVRATAAVSRVIPKSSQMLFPTRSEESALLMWREGAPTRDPHSNVATGVAARQMCLALAWRSALALPSSFPTLVTLSDLNLSSRAKSRDLLFCFYGPPNGEFLALLLRCHSERTNDLSSRAKSRDLLFSCSTARLTRNF
jgi:hypothetical protein